MWLHSSESLGRGVRKQDMVSSALCVKTLPHPHLRSSTGISNSAQIQTTSKRLTQRLLMNMFQKVGSSLHPTHTGQQRHGYGVSSTLNASTRKRRALDVGNVFKQWRQLVLENSEKLYVLIQWKRRLQLWLTFQHSATVSWWSTQVIRLSMKGSTNIIQLTILIFHPGKNHLFWFTGIEKSGNTLY